MAKYLSVFLTFVFFAMHFGMAGSQGLYCDDRVQVMSESLYCYHVAQEELTWCDAQKFCHQRKGWLVSRVDDLFGIDQNVLVENGIKKIWSGLHIKNGRLLVDTNPTLRELGSTEDVDFSNMGVKGAECFLLVHKEYTCNGESDLPCLISFVKELTSCTEKHLFICQFLGVRDDYPMIREVNGVSLTRKVFLPMEVFLAKGKSSNADIDEACQMTLAGGRAYRYKDKPTLSMQFSGGGYSKMINASNIARVLWVKPVTGQCTAIIFPTTHESIYLESSTIDFQESSWPCNNSQSVLCEIDKIINGTKHPRIEVLTSIKLVNVTPNEIQMPSSIIVNLTTIGEFTPEKNFTMMCIVDDLQSSAVQDVTVFKNFIPIRTVDRMDFSRWRVSMTSEKIGFFYEYIDYNQYFHCEVNDLKTGTILESQHLFLRLTDYEIYSVHVGLVGTSNLTEKLSQVLFQASILNQWSSGLPTRRTLPFESTLSSGDGPTRNTLNPETAQTITTTTVTLPLQGQSSQLLAAEGNATLPGTSFASIEPIGIDSVASGSDLVFLDSALKKLSFLVQDMGFAVKPVLYKKDEQKLVTYFYKIFDSNYSISNMSNSLLMNITNSIKTAFKLSGLLQFDANSVEVFSIDWCWPIQINDSSTNQNYELPKSAAGFEWTSPQLCAQDEQPLATVRCEGDKIVGLHWGRFQINPLCNYSSSPSQKSNFTLSLQLLSQANISNGNVGRILQSTYDILNKIPEKVLVAEDVAYVADILQKSTNGTNLSPTVVQNILDCASAVNKFPLSVLKESQKLANATNRVLKAIDQLGNVIESLPDPGISFQRLISGGLAMEVWDISRNYDSLPVIGLKLLSDGSTEMLTTKNLISLFDENNIGYRELVVAIILPRNLIESYITDNSRVRLAMNVNNDTTLHVASVVDQNTNKSLNSKVIAAKLIADGQVIRDLGSYSVKTYFLPLVSPNSKSHKNLTTCSYWDFDANSGAGGWSNKGCMFQTTIEGRDVCSCDHLTNFAILMNFYDQDSIETENQLALSIISIIGLSLSIAGLGISILSFIFIKSLHKSRPQQTLFQMSLALISSWIVFLAGITQTSSHVGCIVVAVLLHYFILASFMWMLMEGILQYLLFVKVLNTYFTHYLWKTAIPAWGLPAIPVVIVLAIDTELYRGGKEYCWLSLPAFYYGFIIPVGLIILSNIVFFILVVISLCRRQDMSKHSSVKKNQMLVNIRASIICFCVLGLTWIFGFLTIDDARLVFQYFFCILNAFQGFIIFIMMTLRDKNIRAFWWSKLGCCCRRLKKRDGGSETPTGELRVHNHNTKANSSTNSTEVSNNDRTRQPINPQPQPYQWDILAPDY